MPGYVVDVNDPTKPTDTQGAKQGAEEIRALKAAFLAIAVAGTASPSKRQAIQSASVDANGQNNAITVGVGLRPGLSATATPYQLSYATGFTGGKPTNLDESITADVVDILGANLPISNTSYLWKLWNSVWGNTLIPPQEGLVFDRTKQALLNFEGINGAVATTDDAGNTWTFGGNAQIDTAQKQFGTSSLKLDGAGDFLDCANTVSFGADSWEVSMWVRWNVLPTPGTRQAIFNADNATGFGYRVNLFNNAGVTKLEFNASSDGTTNSISNAGLGANTVWAINTWHKLRFVFDLLGGTHRCYLSIAGALETQDFNVNSTAKICVVTSFRIGSRPLGGLGDLNGWVDAFRFLPCATNTTVEVPAVVAPTITDYLITFFNISQMKFFDVTAASLIAGTNPTLTAASREIVAEADTSAVAVTSVRNRAIRGYYRSPLQGPPMPAGAAVASFAANIGTMFGVKVGIKTVFLSSSSNFTQRAEADIFAYADAAGNQYMAPAVYLKDKNTVNFRSGTAGLIILDAVTGGAVGLQNSAANAYYVEAERTW